MLKVIVAGSRNFCKDIHLQNAKRALQILKDVPRGVQFVSGGARGADLIGETIATTWMELYPGKFDLRVFPAKWDKYGRSAGHIRNREMAEYADSLCAFWDGKSRGTRNMIETMMELNKPFIVFDFEGNRL